jgi:hypothetical protein
MPGSGATRATFCTGIVFVAVAVAACGDDSAEAEDYVRDGCQQLTDSPLGSSGWGKAWDQAGPSLRKAAELDNSWDGLAAAHDAVLNLPTDLSPGKFLTQIQETKRTLRQGCANVHVRSKLFKVPPGSRPGGLGG